MNRIPLRSGVLLVFVAVAGCGDAKPAGDSFARRYDQAMAETDAERRAGLLIRLAAAQYSAKDVDGVERSLGAATSAARDVTDAAGRASLFRRVAIYQARAGNRSGAANALRAAHGAAKEIEEVEQRASALCGIADAEGVGLKQTATARKSLERALALVEEVPDLRGKVTILASAGSTYARIGDAEKASELIAKAMALVDQIDDPAGQTGALVRIAQAQRRMDDSAAALETLDRALTVAHEIEDNNYNKTLKLADIAEQLARCGDKAKARQLIAETDKLAGQVKDTGLRQQATQRVERANIFIRKLQQ